MQLSIIMTIYDETIEVVKRALSSISFFECSNFEVIIIVDKPDYTEMKFFLNKNYSNQDDYNVIFNEKNIGAGESRNIGVSFSKGDYIAILDADDEYIGDKLIKQYTYLESNKNIDMVFTGWEEVDTKNFKKETRIPAEEWFEKPGKYFFIKSMFLHASLMVRSDVMKNYSYPRIKRGEDFGLFMQMISDKVRFGLIPEPLYRYYVTKGTKEEHRIKIYIFSRNFLLFLTGKINKFIFNPYFWIMYIRIVFEYLASSNIFLYNYVYLSLKRMVKKLVA